MYYYDYSAAPKTPAVRAQHSGTGKQLAQSYVPAQEFRKVYGAMDALKYGTVFEELNQGYGGRGK